MQQPSQIQSDGCQAPHGQPATASERGFLPVSGAVVGGRGESAGKLAARERSAVPESGSPATASEKGFLPVSRAPVADRLRKAEAEEVRVPGRELLATASEKGHLPVSGAFASDRKGEARMEDELGKATPRLTPSKEPGIIVDFLQGV